MKRFILVAAALVAGLFGTAHAAIPVAASTAITDLQTDAVAMTDLFWPVIGTLTAIFVLMRIFKRGSNKI